MTRKNSEKSKAPKGVYARTSATFKELYYNVLVNMKIRNKLLLSFFSLMALPLVISLVTNLFIINPLMMKNTVALEQNSISQYCRDVEYKMSLYDTMQRLIISDKEINESLKKEYSNNLDVVYAYYDHFNTIMAPYARFNSNLKHLTVYLDNDSILYDNFYLKPQDGEFLASDAYRALFIDMKPRYIALEDGVISYYRKMNYYPYDGDGRYPVLRMNILTQELSAQVAESGSPGDMFIMDGSGNHYTLQGNSGRFAEIESHLGQIDSNKGIIGGRSFNEQVIVYEKTSFGWTVVKLIEPTSFFSEAIYVRNAVSFSLVICAAVLMVFILVISRWLTVRTKMLTQKIEEIKNGNYDSKMPIYGKDEIGEASLALDDLSSELKNLIDSVYKSGLENQKLELDVMQAKINPHFLYNTLSAMDWFLQKNDVKTSQILLNSMVLFYRCSLGSGSDVVSITDEVTHLRMYLNIEERLLDNIASQIDIPDEMLGVRMVRMTLQPIVENALKHAMHDTEQILHIHVHGYLEGPRAIIIVDDDGVGFSVGQLEEYEKSRTIKVGEFGSGMGISNVDRRIRLRFGEDFGVSISNNSSGGARIIIEVPYTGFE